MAKKNEIKIFGDMYLMNAIEVEQEDIQRLIDARDGDNDFWDDIDDIREEILGDSLINGFTIVNGANFTVEINGEENKSIVEDFDKALENHGAYSMDWDSADYLVYEEWSTGSSKHVVTGKVVLENIELDLEDQALPNGDMKTVMTPNYDGEEFEFVGSKTKKIALYILTRDGEKISL